MIKTLIQAYQRFRRHQRANETLKETDVIVSGFKVVELNGNLYLTCNGTPFELLSPHLTTQEIKSKLETARSAALHYHNQHKRENVETYQEETFPAILIEMR